MKIIIKAFITTAITCSLFLSCDLVENKDEMILERNESPVLITIDSKSFDDESDIVMLDASFYELDKSGILDQDVGIDSIEVSGLEVDIFVRDTEHIETLTTNDEGQISFENSLDELGYSEEGEVVLELAGTHNEVDFRHIESF